MDEHVVLVDEGELLTARLGLLEGVADHALDADGGVQGDLGGDLEGGAGAHGAAVADVGALGALAHDEEVDLARLGQRGGDAREQAGGAQVHEVVEAEAELQQQAPLEHAGGDAGVADGAEQDRVVLGQGGHVLVGEGLARAVPAPRPEVEGGRLDGDAGGLEGGAQGAQPLGDDLLADAVALDDGQAQGARGGGGAHGVCSSSEGDGISRRGRRRGWSAHRSSRRAPRRTRGPRTRRGRARRAPRRPGRGAPGRPACRRC